MNQAELRNVAAALENELQKHADDSAVSSLHRSLEKYIEAAKSGEIQNLTEWGEIPGARMFSEGSLERNYPELEDAFANFRLAVTGQPS